MSWAIRVESLGKKYRRGEAQTLNTNFREALSHATRRAVSLLHSGRILSRPDVRCDVGNSQEFWALQDINVEIQEGEVVGIIGRNGAGKSTLLKILSRITPPSTGTIRYRGRVASLLEVGTGFHRELTGRENIYLNGSILGMRRQEITRKLDEIIAFAELGSFLDTPVKFYSSGMHVRLAFAVAAFLEADIVLLDEVLAVGDVAFQRKCLQKVHEVGQAGRTVVFVSHNMTAVRRLCPRTVLLDCGRKIMDGSSEEIITAYLSQYITGQNARAIWRTEWNPPAFQDWFRIDKVETGKRSGTATNLFTMDDDIVIRIHYHVFKSFPQLRFSMHLRTVDDTLVLSSTDADTLASFGNSRDAGLFVSSCRIPAHLLSPAKYVVHLGAYLPNNQIIAGAENVASFEVLETSGPIIPKMLGVVNPLLSWDVETIKDG